jgi:galactokinase
MLLSSQRNQKGGKAAKALSEGDVEYLGQLLNETHSGLSTEFEVSCDELDFMVEQTLKEEGVLGARIMGGGFGGCSINLIKDENVNQVIENISAQYKQAYNIDMKVYQVKISDGINEYQRNEIVI